MNAASRRPARRRDEARALFRNAILDAAEEVFADRGFHRARIQDVAKQARIAVGTVYNHFAHKDEVLEALLEERTEEWVAQIRRHPGEPDAFAARLTAVVARLLSYVEHHRPFFAVAHEHGLFAGASPPSAPTARKRLRQVERFRQVVRALLDDGIAAGALEPLDGDALVRFFGGTIRAFVLSSLSDRSADVAEQARTVVDLFLHGAAMRSARRPARERATRKSRPR